jgi:hypothetical protein
MARMRATSAAAAPRVAGAWRSQPFVAWMVTDRAALWAHAGSLLLAAAVLFFLNRHRWFMWDEWVFFAVIHPWFLAGDWKDFLFAPYVSHWVTIPNLLWEAAYRIGRTHSYWVYLVAPISAHLGVTALVRTAVRRAGVGAWPATLFSLPLLFTGAGAGNLTFGWQIQFVGAVFFGLAQLLVSDHDGPVGRRDLAGVGLGMLGLMFSAVSLAMVPMVGINLALRSRWRAAAVAVLPLAAAFLVWFFTIGHHGAPIQPVFQLAQLPLFVWTGVAATFDGLTGIVGIAPLVVVGGVVLAIRKGLLPRTPGLTAPWAMAAAPLFLFLLAGYGRIGAGVQYATESRYVYIGVACFIPLLAVIVMRYLDGAPIRWALAAFLAWSIVFNVANLYLEIHLETERGQAVRGVVLNLANDPNLFSMDPNQAVNVPAVLDLTVGVIQRMVRAGDLP